MTTVTTDRDGLAHDASAAADAMLSWLRQFAGYRGLMVLSDDGSGTAHFVTFWEDEIALRQSEFGRKQVREQMAKTAGAEIESSQPYVVRVVDGFE